MLALACLVALGGVWLLPSSEGSSGRLPPHTQTTKFGSLEPLHSQAAPSATAVPVQAAPLRASTMQPSASPAPVRHAALPPSPTVPEPQLSAPEARYVTGKRVPMRDAPAAGSPILDRLGSGQEVAVLERQGDWVRVRHGLTQREGWMQAKRLSDQAPAAEEVKPKPPSVAPELSTAAIAKLLIAASLASYPSSCACPYNTDRGGRSCGRRSAYTRPGGYSPLCYAKDITPEMVAAYRANH